ncbi:phosphate ABC transporter substrate-binding protein [Clostridium oceanicum]|uniref:Phosphate-binding protein n=1 Tax=Clostridium oceanicum TaxID=1543 RepID=A0ABN1JRC7_9CLOT
MKKKLAIVLSLALSVGIVFAGCSKKSDTSKDASKDNGKIVCIGSSTLAPVISKAGDSLKDKTIKVSVSSGGSGAGVKAAIEKTANFGLVSREVSGEEKGKMKNYKEIKLGFDALTVSVNPKNEILKDKESLTKEEIQKIFSGEAKYWSDVDSKLPKEKIVLVVRDAGGGAAKVFKKAVMGDKKVSKDAIQAPSMGALTQKIIDNKNAIGYASVGLVKQNEGKLIPMAVDGIKPTRENILNKKYKISRPLLVVKDGDLNDKEKTFVDFLKSDKGLKIVDDSGFISNK